MWGSNKDFFLKEITCTSNFFVIFRAIQYFCSLIWPRWTKWTTLSTGWITIQWIEWFLFPTLIRWIPIYSGDSVFQPSNNRGQKLKRLYHLITQILNSTNLHGLILWISVKTRQLQKQNFPTQPSLPGWSVVVRLFPEKNCRKVCVPLLEILALF